MELVAINRRAGLHELTYRVALGTYQVYRCDVESGRCSSVRGEQTDCRHLRDAQQAAQEDAA
jgi:hypothetical protein